MRNRHDLILMMVFLLTSKCCSLITKTVRTTISKYPISLHKRDTKLYSTKQKKYVIVTGGVISGIGKGITASSVGVVLKMLGLKPTAMKIDPYLNVDAGTMSPFEHGETFVLDDGAECDLDLGNYERFLDVRLTDDSSLTTGKVYQTVIAKERKGDYLGKTVQIIPHITDEIMNRIIAVSQKSVQPDNSNVEDEPDVCIVELGGTVGDIESMPFIEAIRQLQLKVKPINLCLIHVSMVPTVGDNGEQKTKPTQHSVKEMRSLGLAPDFIVCRSKQRLDENSKTKISLFCNVAADHVLSMYDLDNIYQAPLVMIQQGFHELLVDRLGLNISILQSTSSSSSTSSSLITSHVENNAFYKQWSDMTKRMDLISDEVIICVIGKYTNQGDSYVSLVNAIKHSCVATNQKLKLIMIESTHLEKEILSSQPDLYNNAWEKLKSADGVVVPGGFGYRGVEGKIAAIQYVRENKIPFLGVCLGMQMAVIEYARNVLGLTQANSEEFVPVNPESPLSTAVVFMPEGSREVLGGTMRLGSRVTVLKEGSQAMKLYNLHSPTAAIDDNSHSGMHKVQQIEERHRHRYEVNPNLVEQLESKGMIFSGKDTTGERMEIIELPNDVHPFFLGCQFHPEYKSRPLRPAPTFLALLKAVAVQKIQKNK